MSKIWLITGSSRGLGRQLAEAVLAAGHQLVATARRPEQLDDLVQRYGDRVRAVALDVTDPVAARTAIDRMASGAKLVLRSLAANGRRPNRWQTELTLQVT